MHIPSEGLSIMDRGRATVDSRNNGGMSSSETQAEDLSLFRQMVETSSQDFLLAPTDILDLASLSFLPDVADPAAGGEVSNLLSTRPEAQDEDWLYVPSSAPGSHGLERATMRERANMRERATMAQRNAPSSELAPRIHSSGPPVISGDSFRDVRGHIQSPSSFFSSQGTRTSSTSRLGVTQDLQPSVSSRPSSTSKLRPSESARLSLTSPSHGSSEKSTKDLASRRSVTPGKLAVPSIASWTPQASNVHHPSSGTSSWQSPVNQVFFADGPKANLLQSGNNTVQAGASATAASSPAKASNAPSTPSPGGLIQRYPSPVGASRGPVQSLESRQKLQRRASSPFLRQMPSSQQRLLAEPERLVGEAHGQHISVPSLARSASSGSVMETEHKSGMWGEIPPNLRTSFSRRSDEASTPPIRRSEYRASSPGPTSYSAPATTVKRNESEARSEYQAKGPLQRQGGSPNQGQHQLTGLNRGRSSSPSQSRSPGRSFSQARPGAASPSGRFSKSPSRTLSSGAGGMRGTAMSASPGRGTTMASPVKARPQLEPASAFNSSSSRTLRYHEVTSVGAARPDRQMASSSAISTDFFQTDRYFRAGESGRIGRASHEAPGSTLIVSAYEEDEVTSAPRIPDVVAVPQESLPWNQLAGSDSPSQRQPSKSGGSKAKRGRPSGSSGLETSGRNFQGKRGIKANLDIHAWPLHSPRRTIGFRHKAISSPLEGGAQEYYRNTRGDGEGTASSDDGSVWGPGGSDGEEEVVTGSLRTAGERAESRLGWEEEGALADVEDESLGRMDDNDSEYGGSQLSMQSSGELSSKESARGHNRSKGRKSTREIGTSLEGIREGSSREGLSGSLRESVGEVSDGDSPVRAAVHTASDEYREQGNEITGGISPHASLAGTSGVGTPGDATVYPNGSIRLTDQEAGNAVTKGSLTPTLTATQDGSAGKVGTQAAEADIESVRQQDGESDNLAGTSVDIPVAPGTGAHLASAESLADPNDPAVAGDVGKLEQVEESGPDLTTGALFKANTLTVPEALADQAKLGVEFAVGAQAHGEMPEITGGALPGSDLAAAATCQPGSEQPTLISTNETDVSHEEVPGHEGGQVLDDVRWKPSYNGATASGTDGPKSGTESPLFDEEQLYVDLVDKVKAQIAGWKLEDKTIEAEILLPPTDSILPCPSEFRTALGSDPVLEPDSANMLSPSVPGKEGGRTMDVENDLAAAANDLEGPPHPALEDLSDDMAEGAAIPNCDRAADAGATQREAPESSVPPELEAPFGNVRGAAAPNEKMQRRKRPLPDKSGNFHPPGPPGVRLHTGGGFSSSDHYGMHGRRVHGTGGASTSRTGSSGKSVSTDAYEWERSSSLADEAYSDISTPSTMLSRQMAIEEGLETPASSGTFDHDSSFRPGPLADVGHQLRKSLRSFHDTSADFDKYQELKIGVTVGLEVPGSNSSPGEKGARKNAILEEQSGDQRFWQPSTEPEYKVSQSLQQRPACGCTIQ